MLDFPRISPLYPPLPVTTDAPEVLLNGTYVGWDMWREGLTEWLRAFPDIQHHVDHVIADEDLVAVSSSI
jgi:predicted ester cyclase